MRAQRLEVRADTLLGKGCRNACGTSPDTCCSARMEATDPTHAQHTVEMMTGALDWLKVGVFATVIAPGVLERGVVREHPDVLEAARRAGREAVESCERLE